jgi:hypothetical protein
MKESLPKENLYFIRYTCNACAPWPEFSRISTITNLDKTNRK